MKEKHQGRKNEEDEHEGLEEAGEESERAEVYLSVAASASGFEEGALVDADAVEASDS